MKRKWKVAVPALTLALTLTACGNRDSGMTNNGTADSGPVSGSVEQNGRTAHRRTAYDYLNDGKYAADRKGRVNGAWDPMARDFTQGARDLVKDAGDAVMDMGRDVGRTVGDMGRNVRSAVRDMAE